MLKRFRPLFGVTLIMLLAVIDLTMLLRSITPEQGMALVRFEGRTALPTQMPVRMMSMPSAFDVTMTLTAPWLRITTYRVIPDNCIRALTVNGQSIPLPAQGICDYNAGFTVDLSNALRHGQNTVTASLWNGGGIAGFTMTPARSDPVLATITLLLCAVLLAYAVFVGKRLWPKSTKRWLPMIIVAGAILRILYLGVTPFAVRGHDYDGHLGYVLYVADHGALPLESYNKQTYHPPLYHATGAAVWAIGRATGVAPANLPALLQIFSLVLSIATLVLGVAVGMLFLRGAPLLLYAAGIAAFPALILIAPQINNDAMVQLWMVLGLLLLLRWWKSSSVSTWAFFSCVIGFGMLTKSNAAIIGAAGGLCLLLRPGVSARRKIGLLGLLCATLFLSNQTFLRGLENRNPRDAFVSNYFMLTNTVPNTPRALLTFSPIDIVRIPFNNPFLVEARKDYAPEFFFRSVLFGEYNFGARMIWLARVMVVFALLLLPFFLSQWIGELFDRKSPTFPLAICVLAGFGAMAAYRILLPFSSSQDFRCVIFLAFPVCYYLAAPRHMRSLLRNISSILCVLLIVFSAAFFALFSLR